MAKNDLCAPSISIGFEPKTLTFSSQDITESQQLGGNQFDHGKQCGGQLDSHWLSPPGREDPYLWQGTTGWSREIALDSLLEARQISTLGDLRTAVSIQALGTICSLGGKKDCGHNGAGVGTLSIQCSHESDVSHPFLPLYIY